MAEVVKQYLRLLGKDGKRCIVAHRAGRLGTGTAHRGDDALNVFAAVSEGAEQAVVILFLVGHLATRFEFVQFHAVVCQPISVRMRIGKLLLYLSVIIYLAFFRVDKQYLARLETPLFLNLAGFKAHHADFGSDNHHIVFSDKIAGRAQTIAVEHTAGIPSVAEHEGGGTVPRLHQDGMVFVEGFQVFRYGILLVEVFGHKHRHRMGQTHAGGNKELQHVIQRGTVAHARLHDGTDFIHIGNARRGEDAFAGFHPTPVSAYRIDFPVMRQQAERLRKAPCGKSIGAEARMHKGNAAREILTDQIRVIMPQLHRFQHAFIDNISGGQRGYVEIALRIKRQLADVIFNPFADNV
ncbi:hypothetical protein Barb6_00407 [Bacteroidales bacterium Barb6]|nr:hypothetical protein Barb6_00407 [Bacteroidales bacterium Barb6]